MLQGDVRRMINLNNFNMKHIFNNKNKNFLFESTSLGQLQTSVIIWDETDEIVYLSPLAKEIFQRETREEVNEKCSWTNLFPAEIVYKVNEHFNKTTEQLHLQDVTVHTDGKHKFKYDLTIDNILIHKKDHYICLLQDLSYIKGFRTFIARYGTTDVNEPTIIRPSSRNSQSVNIVKRLFATSPSWCKTKRTILSGYFE